jgi:hypothetical protein
VGGVGGVGAPTKSRLCMKSTEVPQRNATGGNFPVWAHLPPPLRTTSAFGASFFGPDRLEEDWKMSWAFACRPFSDQTRSVEDISVE